VIDSLGFPGSCISLDGVGGSFTHYGNRIILMEASGETVREQGETL